MTGNHTREDIRNAVAQLATLGCVVASVLLVAWLSRTAISALIYSEGARGFDAATMSAMQTWAGPSMRAFFFWLTTVGSPVAMWIVCAAGLLWLLPRARPVVMATWIAAFSGSSAISTGLKHIILRARPEGAERYLFSTSYSFPSTHALASLVGYGLLAYVVCQYYFPRQRERTMIALCALVMIAVIAASRLVLGVHYATDVLGGLLLGAFWLSLCILLLRRSLNRLNQPRD